MDKTILLNRIKQSVNKKDPNAEIYLFGSRARGDNNENSDWDILILIDKQKVTNEIEDDFRDDLYDIELEAGQIISTFIYPHKYWTTTLSFTPLYAKVNKEGIKL